MRWFTGTLLTAILTFGTGTLVQAADPATQPPRGTDEWRAARQERRAGRREEMREKIEIIRIARLTDELDLDPDTAARLVPVLSRFDELERTHRESRATLGRELNLLVESGTASDRDLRAAMERLWDNETQHVAGRRALFDEVGDVLNTEQQARLMLFVPRFQRQMRELAQQLRQQRQGGPEGGPQGPWGGGQAGHPPYKPYGDGGAPGGPEGENF